MTRRGPVRVVLVALVVALALAVGSQPATAQTSVTLKMQASWPAGQTLYDNFKMFAEKVDKMSGGRLKTGLRYPTTTDRDGFYLVVLHLHDEDQGDRLAVSANGAEGEVVARFDAKDKKVERGTRVDVRGRSVVENRRAFAETLRAYLSR